MEVGFRILNHVLNKLIENKQSSSEVNDNLNQVESLFPFTCACHSSRR